jgi:hypothetical protein
MHLHNFLVMDIKADYLNVISMTMDTKHLYDFLVWIPRSSKSYIS